MSETCLMDFYQSRVQHSVISVYNGKKYYCVYTVDIVFGFFAVIN